eukprot:224576_1
MAESRRICDHSDGGNTQVVCNPQKKRKVRTTRDMVPTKSQNRAEHHKLNSFSGVLSVLSPNQNIKHLELNGYAGSVSGLIHLLPLMPNIESLTGITIFAGDLQVLGSEIFAELKVFKNLKLYKESEAIAEGSHGCDGVTAVDAFDDFSRLADWFPNLTELTLLVADMVPDSGDREITDFFATGGWPKLNVLHIGYEYIDLEGNCYCVRNSCGGWATDVYEADWDGLVEVCKKRNILVTGDQS